jgi:CubicO group peptidase (beta-lactamase class C family)
MDHTLSRAGLQAIESYLSEITDKKVIPGYVALVAKGQNFWIASGGKMAYDSPQTMDQSALFRLSSMSKPLTVAATMRLVDEGVLALTDPITKWMPELKDLRVLRTLESPLHETVPARRDILVRDLLTSMVGTGMVMLPPDSLPILKAFSRMGLAIGPPSPQTHLPADEFVRRLSELPLLDQPGERWFYHTPVVLLSILLERVCGQRLDRVLSQRLFEPLGMVDTTFVVTESNKGRLPCSYLTDFDKGTPEVYDRPATSQWAQEPLFFNGADGLVSTAHDYFRFASMLLHSGVANGKRILSAESVAAMTRNQLKAGSGFMGDESYYGFGLGLQVVIREGLPGEKVGQFNWDGGLGTTWFVAPHQGLIAILLTQKAWTSPQAPSHVVNFNRLAHEA